MEYKADILQGTLDLMVLQTLASMGPLHGYAIASRFEQVSHGSIQLNMGTLYPALMRLEQRRLIRGKWAITENNRRARFLRDHRRRAKAIGTGADQLASNLGNDVAAAR